ncbi:MAG: helix-turn-helix domain-containing protein [Planctomycetota bacterium]|jgi:excisionase family DNA binding protein
MAKNKDILTKDVLTTGDIAKICNVSIRTASKWFDKGLLKGYQLPGSGDRRIPADEFQEFAKKYNMPYKKQKPKTKGD